MKEKEVRSIVREELGDMLDSKLGPLLDRLSRPEKEEKGEIQVSVPKSKRTPIRRVNNQPTPAKKSTVRKHTATPKAVRDLLADNILSLIPYFTVDSEGLIHPTLPDSLEECAELLGECYGFLDELMKMHNIQMASHDTEIVLEPINKKGFRKQPAKKQEEKKPAVVNFDEDDDEEFGFSR